MFFAAPDNLGSTSHESRFGNGAGGTNASRTVHIHRTRVLLNASCFERILLRNYGLAPLSLDLVIDFEADFADIFEVRGHRREHRGMHLTPEFRDSGVTLGYEGLDRIIRQTRITCSPRPSRWILRKFAFHFIWSHRLNRISSLLFSVSSMDLILLLLVFRQR